MHRKFHQKMEEMLRRDEPFIVATVINVRGSAAAKPGAKAIIDAEGRPVFGWVGGGCVESCVCAEARAAIEAGVPRVITADLEDELSGVGLPCGGVMEIFIEPVAPRRRVLVLGESALAIEASQIMERVGFAVTHQAAAPGAANDKELEGQNISPVESDLIDRGSLVILAPREGEDISGFQHILKAAPAYAALLSYPSATAQTSAQLRWRGIREESLSGLQLRAGLDLGASNAAEMALSVAAEILAVTRGATARPLQETRMGKPVEGFQSIHNRVGQPALVITGHSGITEELAWLATRLGWRVSVDSTSAIEESYPPEVNIVRDDTDFSRLPVSPDTAVIVATHHKGDHLAIERSLKAGAWYVGLIASAHRSKLVRAMLEDLLHGDARMRHLRTPSGLDLGATTPAEIALSIMSEVLACFHGRTGSPRVPAQAYEESRR
jgi:xanthine dehydrogenase accessory factor